MKEVWQYIQIGLAAVGGALGWILGGLDNLVYALVAFVVIDFITGVMCAAAEKKLSAAEGFRGVMKKVTIFALIAVGHIVDLNVIGPLGIVGDHSAVRSAILFFYLATEGISLLENAARLGLPIPKKLKDILAQLHGKDDPGKNGHKKDDHGEDDHGEGAQ